jgi:hypothetical protein
MSQEHSPARQRRFGKISQAVEYSGVSRSRLYEWGAEHRGLFRKQGRSSLVDYTILDQILNSLPAAKLKPAAPRKPASS